MDVPQAFSTKTTNVLGGQLKTPASPLYKTCLAILITAALTACGSSSSGDDDAAATLEDAVGEPEDTSDTPSAPGTDTPSAPATDTPSAPATDTPSEPGADTPSAPGTDTPSEPGTDTPSEPGADTPSEPGADTPSEPGTDTPSEPGTDTGENVPTPGDNGNANISMFGSVSFSGGFDLDDNDAFGSFSSSPVALPLQEVINAFDLGTDTCDVFTFDLTNPPVPGESTVEDTISPDLDLDSNSISAGEVLTVISPAGTFAELIRVQSEDDIDYELADGSTLPGPIPAGTVLNIPGDVFPAFNNVPVPPAPDVMNFAPIAGPIPVSANYTWVPEPAGTLSGIVLSLISDFSLDDPFTTFSSVSCILQDDGSFTLPADIQAQLGSDFQVGGLTVVRFGTNIVSQGNAALAVTTTSGFSTIEF